MSLDRPSLITQFGTYKISLHVDSAAGAMMVCRLLVSPLFLVLTPLVALVAWARWKLGAHSPLQVLCGAALAIAMTIITFWLFFYAQARPNGPGRALSRRGSRLEDLITLVQDAGFERLETEEVAPGRHSAFP